MLLLRCKCEWRPGRVWQASNWNCLYIRCETDLHLGNLSPYAVQYIQPFIDHSFHYYIKQNLLLTQHQLLDKRNTGSSSFFFHTVKIRVAFSLHTFYNILSMEILCKKLSVLVWMTSSLSIAIVSKAEYSLGHLSSLERLRLKKLPGNDTSDLSCNQYLWFPWHFNYRVHVKGDSGFTLGGNKQL